MLTSKARQELNRLAFSLIHKLKPAPITVGLSGGADSTLALLVACKLQETDPRFSVLACHCIHGLDADDPIWLKHCQDLCQRLKVKLVTPKLNIVYGNGVSPEDASRKERYRALLENLSLNGYLMLGHQSDDQVENLLLALKRGSGPRGLGGMSTVTCDNRGTIIRPLLDLSKKDIENILTALGFDWVFDISNTYLKFERNFIRLKVLPLLRQRFIGIDKAILKSAKLCAFEHDLASRYAETFYTKAVADDIFYIDKIDIEDQALTFFVLRRFLFNFSSSAPDFNTVAACYDLIKASNDQEGVVEFADKEIRRYLNTLRIVSKAITPNKDSILILHKNETLCLNDFAYSLIKGRAKNKSFILKSDCVILDFTYSGSFKIKPVNRVHRREIKKIFGENFIPYWERAAYPLVKDKDTVLALGSVCALGKKEDLKAEDVYYLEIKNLKTGKVI